MFQNSQGKASLTTSTGDMGIIGTFTSSDESGTYWTRDSIYIDVWHWELPAGMTNAEAERDFVFTYSGVDMFTQQDAGSISVNVHVGYAEVWGWADQPVPGTEIPYGPDPNDPNRQCSGHGSWEIVVDPGSIPLLKRNATTAQIALLDTYANHKWGWGAVDENYCRNLDGSFNRIIAFQSTPGMLRCDDDYETRYDPDPDDNNDILYPYDVKKGWTISQSGLFSVMEYTGNLQQAGLNGTQSYHLVTNNCVLRAVGAINAAGVSFSLPSGGFTPAQFGEALFAAGGERLN